MTRSNEGLGLRRTTAHRCASLFAIFFAGVVALAASPHASADIRYVDATAPSGGNGLSWATAYRGIQNALNAAIANPAITEIWVADGTYKPTKRTDAADPRSVTFDMKNGLAIYGGFAGNETALAQRNPAVNITILSGELGVIGDNTDNAYHVVNSEGDNATAIIDGFQIRDGFAYFGPSGSTYGGGLRLFNTAAQVRNCDVRNCAASDYGSAAACLASSNVTFTDCTFQLNTSQSGPAVEVQLSAATFVGCTFTSNSPNGACRVYGNATGTFTDCVFQANSGSNGSGVSMVTTESTATFADCQFLANSGSPALSLQGTFAITGCLFQGNTGGVISYGNTIASPTLRDSTFLGNASATGAACITGGDDLLVARNCVFKDNTNANGGGSAANAYVIGFVDCTFENNSAGYGGAVRAQDNVWLVNCRLAGNHATGQGGAVYVASSGPVTIANCLITGNTAGSYGGGVYVSGSNQTTIQGCTIVGNSAPNGAGVLVDSTTKIQNSLLWGNSGAVGTTEQQQLRVLGVPSLTLASNSIQGWTGTLASTACDGNDPAFLGVAGPDAIVGTADDNPAVGVGSPAIDSGNGAIIVTDVVDADEDGNTSEQLPLDLLGDARTQGDTVDRGAAESNPTAGNGVFIGKPGGSWFTPANWSGGNVPDATTDVVIGTAVVIDQPGASAASVTIDAGGTLTTQQSLTTESITVAVGATLALDASANVSTVDLTLNGSLAFDAGTLTIDGGALTSAGAISFGCVGDATLVLDDASISAPSVHICTNGTLTGDGSVVASVVSDGTIDPAGASRSLACTGSFVQSSTGTVHVDLASAAFGAAHDLLTLETGPVTLGGTLAIALEAATAQPASFTVLVAPASSAGRFATVALPRAIGEFAFAAPLAFGSVTVTSASTVPVGTRLYVRANGSPLGTGSTWGNSLANLSQAIAIATSNAAIDSIWVGEGTYVPEADGTPGTPPDGPRAASFRMLDGVALVGGFAGGESSLEERDIAAHPTILLGDLAGNDTSNESTKLENAYSVVTAVGVGASATLDGFVVRGGWANGLSGVGVAGGGAHIQSSSCVIRNSTFESNGASDGGAIALIGGSPTLDACTIRANLDFGDTAAGVSVAGGTATLTNCVFESNKASDGAAAGLSSSGATVVVSGCTFTSNIGIGARSEGGTAQFTNCQFVDNADPGSLLVGAGAAVIGGTASFTQCTFDGNAGLAGAGLLIALASHTTTVTDCVFTDNLASGGPGGGILVSACEPTISGCEFTGNTGFAGGGVAATHEQGNLVGVELSDCTFTDNHAVSNTAAPSLGGGIAIVAGLPGGTPLVRNCAFSGNSAQQGGGAYLQEVVTTLDDSTFSGNSASVGSGVALLWAGEVTGDCVLDGLDELAVTHVLAPSSPPSSTIGTVTTNRLLMLDRGSDYEDRPELRVELGGNFPVTGYDVADVSKGVATLTGTLRVLLANGHVPQAGDEYRVLEAGSIEGQFNAAVFTAVPNGLALTLEYDPNGVTLKLTRLGAAIEFEDPTTETLPGTPVDALTADVDGDGDEDVLVLVAGTVNEGIVTLLRNQGSAGGTWLGFAPATVVATIGLAPSDLAVGDVNADGIPDLVVVASGTKTVSVLLGTGVSAPAFGAPSTLSIGTAPASVAFAAPQPGLPPDLWITRPSSGLLQRLVNNGSGGFSLGASTASIPGVGAITAADLDGDGLADLVAGSASGSGLVAVHRNLGDGELATFLDFEVPTGPVGLTSGDLDNDGRADIVATTSSSVEVFMNAADGSASLRAPVSIPAGTGCVSPTLLDAASDGDLDIGFVTLGAQPPEARIIRNDLVGGSVSFTAVNAVATPGVASRALSGDFDGDGVADLLVVGTSSADSMVGTGELHARLGKSTAIVTGDLNGDGIVNAADLAILLGQWGSAGSADLDGDGTVGGTDLAILLGAWS